MLAGSCHDLARFIEKLEWHFTKFLFNDAMFITRAPKNCRVNFRLKQPQKQKQPSSRATPKAVDLDGNSDDMGFRSILPVQFTITIDTMLKVNGPNIGDGLVVGTREQALLRLVGDS